MKFLLILLVSLAAANAGPMPKRRASRQTSTPTSPITTILGIPMTFFQLLSSSTTGTNTPLPIRQSSGTSTSGDSTNIFGLPIPAPFSQIISPITNTIQSTVGSLGNVTNPIGGILGGSSSPFNTIFNLFSGITSPLGIAIPGVSTSPSSSTTTSTTTAAPARVLQCTPAPEVNRMSNLANVPEDSTLMLNLPAQTVQYQDPVSGEPMLTQTTFGYTVGKQAVIHSILAGSTATLQNYATKVERVDSLSGRAEDDEALMSSALAEYGLRSLTGMASGLIKGMALDFSVGEALDCQLKSFDCILAARTDADQAKVCSEDLCKCIKASFE